jgi:murein DD-endopeptidase MepM/ murein hydrolase activator NlpD
MDLSPRSTATSSEDLDQSGDFQKVMFLCNFIQHVRRTRAPVAPLLAMFATLVLLVGGAPAAPTADAATPNKAALLRWPAYIDTDLQFADFFAKDYTLSARFMPQYPRAYRGPILTVSDELGSFQVGQGDFQDSYNAEKLFLKVGGETRFYVPSTGLPAGTWQHLAVTRRLVYDITGWVGGWPMLEAKLVFSLYLNGEKLCPVTMVGTCNEPHFTSLATPTGVLRLGRTSAAQTGTNQFYGLIDDVAVFSKALSVAEIVALAAPGRLTGQEAGLLRGFTMDATTPSGGALPAQLNGQYTLKNMAWPLTVSNNRVNAEDAALLPPPNPLYAVVLHLPFKSGQVWKVVQGWGGDQSHFGMANFSMDFALGLPKQIGQVTPGKTYPTSTYTYANDPTCGEPVYAAAAGDIIFAQDPGGWGSKPTDFDDGNQVRLQEDTHEMIQYAHLMKNSVHEALGLPFFLPPTGGSFPTPDGLQIGRVGVKNGCHLHMAALNNPGTDSNAGARVTRPSGFFNYQACDAQSGKNCIDPANWYNVVYGVPQTGQMVRN